MCIYECVFAYVCICEEGGSIPRHKLLSFLESLWPTQEERVGGGGGGGGGDRGLGGTKPYFKLAENRGLYAVMLGPPPM